MAVIGQSTGWWKASDGKWYPPEQRPAGTAVGPGFRAVSLLNRAPIEAATFVAPPRRELPKRSMLLAGYVSRSFAAVFDAGVAVVFLWACSQIGWIASIAGAGVGVGVGAGLAVLFVLWYHVWKIAVTGQTWAMHFAHLNVAERTSGQHPIGLGRACKRALVASLLALTGVGLVLDLLWPLWDPYKQTLHDKAAGTVVLHRR
jgi:uncharacterized RDD family membrane protein YckC